MFAIHDDFLETNFFLSIGACFDMRNIKVVSVYVAHHSDNFINKFGFRHKNELGDYVYVINSSSTSSDIDSSLGFQVIDINKNVGFSAANNIGIHHCLKGNPDFFLIINPDVSLPPKWLLNVINVINDTQYSDVGIFTVPLLGYDFEENSPDGFVDSLGIDHTWYGRWFDVSQGDDISVLNKDLSPYEVLAACGALMLIHKDVVRELLDKDGYVFNEAYFMYKEDIELSIRTRKLGKKIMMIPSAPVFHCRGWASNRVDSPYWARELSARNELKMHLKYYWNFLPYSFLKYLYVRFFERFKLKLTKHVIWLLF